MPTEDKFQAMRIRRLLAKKECDLALVEIACRGGMVHLTGQLRKPRGYVGHMDLHDELASIEQLIRRIDGIRDVTSDVRIIS